MILTRIAWCHLTAIRRRGPMLDRGVVPPLTPTARPALATLPHEENVDRCLTVPSP